jgi:hypothetical protein
MPDRAGNAIWPGALSVVSARYTNSQGITPGCAVLVTNPQTAVPRLSGDLIITDLIGSVPIPDCRVRMLRSQGDASSGFDYTLEIEDRRWRWRELGTISGVYNAADPDGTYSRPPPDTPDPRLARPTKLIPWTIKPAFALLKLCLDAMGEVGYSIVMPPFVGNPFPPVTWDHTNPAQALQTLADDMGMRVVYDPISNKTLVLPVGVGNSLPDGSIARESPAISGLARPDSILLVGAPLRFQLRFLVEPVGEDWDRSVRPINDLSFAPQKPALIQICTWTPTTVTAVKYTVQVNGKNYSYTAGGGDTATTICNQLSGIMGNAGFGGALGMGASALNGVLTITGAVNGVAFQGAALAVAPGVAKWAVTQVGRLAGGDWSRSGPPSFWGCSATTGAQGTSRLTKRQARELAAKCVFKWYRIVNADPSTGKFPLTIPGFGKIIRREQVLLQPDMIEQIQPTAGDDQLRNKITAEPLIRDFYDGYQRNKPAQCFGSYFWPVAGPVMPSPPNPNSWNTAPNSLVGVPFTIDPERQIVMFTEPVYIRGGIPPAGAGAVNPAAVAFIAQALNGLVGISDVSASPLVLQTACQVRHPVTNQAVRAEAYRIFGSGKSNGLPAVIKADDFEINFLAKYPPVPPSGVAAAGILAGGLAGVPPNKVVGVLNDLDDAKRRAQYYLLAEAAKWELKEARERVYNGIVPIQLDGAIAQVTWEVGPNGAMTTASRNSEHALHLPSYPERLRIEYQRGKLRDEPQADVRQWRGAPPGFVPPPAG